MRLHYIASNNVSVIASFPHDDLANGLKTIVRGVEDMPFLCSLGLLWNLKLDTFTFKITDDDKPCTRRGVLSSVKSLFDPLVPISYKEPNIGYIRFVPTIIKQL